MDIETKINGKTEVFGIIGNPVKHSLSPILQTSLGRLMGKNCVYVPFCVEDVENAIKGAYSLNIKGFNVTVPHKKNVMEHLVEIDKQAVIIGAVNTLKRIENGFKGFNTDYLGLDISMKMKNILIENKNVVILGAGGGARSAMLVAIENKAKSITIVNRTKENAEALKNHFKGIYSGEINVLNFEEILSIEKPQVVIQTTSIGMSSEETPIKDINFFEKVEDCVDIIYTPWETKFLSMAKEKGCNVLNGFDMLVYQGVAAFEIWNDMKVPEDVQKSLRNAIEEFYKNE